jgi:hypothetical protein
MIRLEPVDRRAELGIDSMLPREQQHIFGQVMHVHVGAMGSGS